MERFVFVAAIVFAVIFGLVAIVGDDGFHIEFDGSSSDGPAAAIVGVEPGELAAQAYAGDRLELRHLAAIVTVTPEDRADFEIAITSPGGTPMPEVSVADGAVIVDGRLRGRVANCREDGVNLRGYGDVARDAMPRITIRAPRSVDVARSGAGSTEIAAADTVNLSLSGCGTATVADVTDQLAVELSGSGTVRAGAARYFKADVSGSGEVYAGAVAEGADVRVAGSGEVSIASLQGDLTTEAAGSGGVVVTAGAINAAQIDLLGSGDVEIGATVQRLAADIAGSGGVQVNNVVGDIDADILGSGTVRAQSVTGTVNKDVMGSGDVRIGG